MDDPEAAKRIAERIFDATQKQLKFPLIGQVGQDEDAREWMIPKTPYMLVYMIREDEIVILRSDQAFWP